MELVGEIAEAIQGEITRDLSHSWFFEISCFDLSSGLGFDEEKNKSQTRGPGVPLPLEPPYRENKQFIARMMVAALLYPAGRLYGSVRGVKREWIHSQNREYLILLLHQRALAQPKRSAIDVEELPCERERKSRPLARN